MTESLELKIDLLSQHALDIMEQTWESLFLTWKAWTWKSTLLRHYITTTKKRVIVLASTWIAAINIGGQTIHSFFRLWNHLDIDELDSLTWKNAKLLYEADSIVIDEVSMVRADLMDCVDKVLRLTLDLDVPFGGKQMIFVWDLYQLPPIVSSYEIEMFNSKYKSAYFFSSDAYTELFPHVISLQKVHRQSEAIFTNVLNKMRIGMYSHEDLKLLDENVAEKFPEGAVYLTTTNKQADELNDFRLQVLDGEMHIYSATISGKISKSMYPNQIQLDFKVWAQIMMIKNGKGFSNGSIGQLVSFDATTSEAVVLIQGEEIVISPHTWQVMKPVYDKRQDKIIAEPVWSFQQMPFRLARAITIHKAQWLTFDNVIVDLSNWAFAQWQSYVALSRATTLAWLYLTQKVKHSDIMVDTEVRRYMHEALREQTHFLVQTAIQSASPVRFLYLDPDLGPTYIQVLPREVGELEHQGYDFHGLKWKIEGETQITAFSYGRIYDVELV